MGAKKDDTQLSKLTDNEDQSNQDQFSIPELETLNTEIQTPVVLAQKKWRSQALSIIHKLSHDILDINQIEPVLVDIANAITSSFPITFTAIETFSDNTLDLSIVAQSEEGINNHAYRKTSATNINQSLVFDTLAGEVLRRKSTFILTDAMCNEYKICPSHKSTSLLYHYIGIPLLVDGEVAGVLSFATTHNMVVDKETINWSETVAHHISALLTREAITAKFKSQEKIASNMLNALASPTMTCSREGLILNFNSAFRLLFEEFHGRTIDAKTTKLSKLFEPKNRLNPYVEEFHRTITRLFEEKIQSLKVDLLISHPTFHRWYLATMSLMPDHETAVVMFVDITDRKHAQERLEFEMLHDQGTGLANRVLFQERLNNSLQYNKKENTQTCVFVLDIGRYAFIIESLGHAAADQIMLKVASRIEALTHPSDLIARIGSSEFAILIEHIHDAQQARQFCLDLLGMFRVPFDISGQEIKLHPSVGIAVSEPTKDTDSDTVIHEAHAAMTQARDSSILSYAFSNSSSTTTAYKKLEKEKELTHAIERGELRVYYQPQYSLHIGELVGLEALVRWEHPKEGLLSPDSFIELAEECGLIEDVFKSVFDQVVNDAIELFKHGNTIKIWTNISARQLSSIQTTEYIRGLISETKVPSSMIGFEITETAIMENSSQSSRILSEFEDMGVSLALDDFGTGYSSLAYLQKFDADLIKIDKSFISNIAVDTSSLEIVSAIIAIAHSLKIQALAEGVENSAQIAILRELGCDRSQGFFYSEPLPLEGLIAFMQED